MNETDKCPSSRERSLVGILAAVVIGTVAWELGRTQRPLFFYLLGVLMIGLALVVATAAWRHGRRWILSRRALRFHLWMALSLLSILVLFYNEESWRGKRAWVTLQREAAARGESLDVSSVIPPPVADDENFLRAPGVDRVLGDPGPEPANPPITLEPADFSLGRPYRSPKANWVYQQATDLGAWQRYFRRYPADPIGRTNAMESSRPSLPAAAYGLSRFVERQLTGRNLVFPTAPQPQTPAADVLLALSKFDTNLAVLRKAAERPKVRYSLDYERGVFARDLTAYHFKNVSDAVHVLSLRASARLSQGQPDAALQDVLLAFRLSRTLAPAWTFSSRSTAEVLMTCLQPVWDGLVAHRWSHSELIALEKQVGSIDPLADFRTAFRIEVLKTLDLLDQMQAVLGGRRTLRDGAPEEGLERFLTGLLRWTFPSGWLYQDKVWFYRFYERYADPLKDVDSRVFDLRGQMKDWHGLMDPLAVTFLVPRMMEVLTTGAPEALFLHTTFQEAGVACALERYRHATGQFPATLDLLVPTYLRQLPRDVLDRKGAALKYQQTDNGGVVLYSVGLDGVDDGGNAGPRDTDGEGISPILPSLDRGDWVWRQPGI